MLTQYKLDEMFVGVEEPDGELNEVENDEESDRRPFKAILDAGLKKTTTGSKIFGALKVGYIIDKLLVYLLFSSSFF